ncbi:MAG TPA: three-Cys-motif partner protein TcmP [Dehalococcoidales bacterium]|nr:three-Cys-motif partner protein TcmP [Dehalococcoidales bacterium]
MNNSFEYDEIGNWSEIKLEIVRKYATAYTTILSKKPYIKKHMYIDGFAGSGTHISEATGEFVKGSPLNALNVNPPFSELHLIDLDGGKAAELRRQSSIYKNVAVYEGDANDILLNTIFPKCEYKDFARALCLLDPYSLKVDWNVLQTAGQMGSIEIFYNFMIMDANMNVLWKDPNKVALAQAERMDKVWGDRSWRTETYVEQSALFGDSGYSKKGNTPVAESFRKRLETAAGFKFALKPVPMKNKQGATIYYLYFATQDKTGAKIVDEIFDKYRARGTA